VSSMELLGVSVERYIETLVAITARLFFFQSGGTNLGGKYWCISNRLSFCSSSTKVRGRLRSVGFAEVSAPLLDKRLNAAVLRDK